MFSLSVYLRILQLMRAFRSAVFQNYVLFLLFETYQNVLFIQALCLLQKFSLELM
jgi:hypothetical protein